MVDFYGELVDKHTIHMDYYAKFFPETHQKKRPPPLTIHQNRPPVAPPQRVQTSRSSTTARRHIKSWPKLPNQLKHRNLHIREYPLSLGKREKEEFVLLEVLLVLLWLVGCIWWCFFSKEKGEGANICGWLVHHVWDDFLEVGFLREWSCCWLRGFKNKHLGERVHWEEETLA